MPSLDHTELCRIAVAWLKRPHSAGGPGCQVALRECRYSFAGEAPDAIGFRAAGWLDGSVVIECKTSRADFLADRAKPHRQSVATGLGNWRYYLAPAGIITTEDLPSGWGLLVARGRSIVALAGPAAHLAKHAAASGCRGDYRDACAAWALPSNLDAERSLLAKTLARVGDPDRLNQMVREANASRQRAWQEVERARASNEAMLQRLYEQGGPE